ncbi:MAG: FecR domain-containing protein, partial [Candidatus Gracilibacteria bacterium]|nr:FecR domain-containing protein [Candidatus Gracilibacteria bacterium]
MQNKKAFTLVEIIIVLSIIMLLGVVAISYQGASNQKSQNTRIIGDVGTLENSILSYLEEKKSLPEPKGNKNYYNSGSEYSHETDIFGVHGFATQNLLPKKYLNYLPLDPRTNQYYAYGKTINTNFYEIAGVLNIDGKYTTKLTGNYTGENGPYSLIREYNGPNFISNKSTNSFPYNPEEKLLVAKINYISGTVTINGNSTNILNHILTQGDIIETSNSSTATIFFSDGSQSVLSENSKLVLEEMKFKQEDNLLTRIKLSLESGILWTKATNLNSDSEKSDFEVSTQDTTAAVRGTIFGVSYIGSTSLTVTKGSVEVNQEATTQIGTVLTQPDFPINTIIPNNTLTGSTIEEEESIVDIIEKEEKDIIDDVVLNCGEIGDSSSEFGKLIYCKENPENGTKVSDLDLGEIFAIEMNITPSKELSGYVLYNNNLKFNYYNDNNNNNN